MPKEIKKDEVKKEEPKVVKQEEPKVDKITPRVIYKG